MEFGDRCRDGAGFPEDGDFEEASVYGAREIGYLFKL